MYEVADGLEYLHFEKIIHGDLRGVRRDGSNYVGFIEKHTISLNSRRIYSLMSTDMCA